MKEKAISVLASLGVGKDEVSKLYDEAKIFLSQTGITGEELDKFTFNNVIGKFHKRKRMLEEGKYEQFESLIIADGRVTDYGAQRQYDKVLADYNKASQEKQHEMVLQGLIQVAQDGTLQPLVQKGFDKGKVLDPKTKQSKEIKAVTKVKGKEVLTTIKLPQKLVELKIPVGFAVKYFGTKSKDSTETNLTVFVQRDIEPAFTVSSEKIDPIVFIEKHFKDDIIPVDQFEQWCNNKGVKRSVWIKANIFSGDSPRQVMLANDAFLGEETLEMWADKPQKFIESCPAVVYCDTFQDTKTGKWKGNVICLYIEEKYKIPEIKSVDPDLANPKQEEKNWEDENGW